MHHILELLIGGVIIHRQVQALKECAIAQGLHRRDLTERKLDVAAAPEALKENIVQFLGVAQLLTAGPQRFFQIQQVEDLIFFLHIRGEVLIKRGAAFLDRGLCRLKLILHVLVHLVFDDGSLQRGDLSI